MESKYGVAKVLTGPTGGTFKIWDNLKHAVYFPRFPDYPNSPTSLDEIEDAEARDDDVLIISYPRSGLHWLWEIVRMLKLHSTTPASNVMEENMIEMRRDLEDLAKMKSPRVFPTHMRFNHLPHSFREKKCKIIHIIRDPRAVALSYFRLFSDFAPESGMKFEGTWDDFLPMFLNNQVPFNGWFEMEKHWEQIIKQNTDYPIYVLKFEDLKRDTVREIQKLATFLNVDASLDFCSEVAASTDFRRLKQAKESVASGTIVNDWCKDGGYPMFRKGTADEWKNIFTVAQHEECMTTFKKEMRGTSTKLLLGL